jgi:hypothetical protein
MLRTDLSLRFGPRFQGPTPPLSEDFRYLPASRPGQRSAMRLSVGCLWDTCGWQSRQHDPLLRRTAFEGRKSCRIAGAVCDDAAELALAAHRAIRVGTRIDLKHIVRDVPEADVNDDLAQLLLQARSAHGREVESAAQLGEPVLARRGLCQFQELVDVLPTICSDTEQLGFLDGDRMIMGVGMRARRKWICALIRLISTLCRCMKSRATKTRSSDSVEFILLGSRAAP